MSPEWAALIGVILGGGITLLTQFFQRRYETKTRFHNLRIDLYSKFLLHANNHIIELGKGNIDLEGATLMRTSGESISLIASKDVLNNLRDILDNIKKTAKRNNDYSHYFQIHKENIRNFVAAARKELKTK